MSSDPLVKAAIAHWGPRFVANGVALTDFEEVTGALTSYNDWCRAWSARAAAPRSSSAARRWRKSISSPPANRLQRAGVYYHFASFLFVHDQAQMKAAHIKQIECRQAALPLFASARRARGNSLSGQDARRHFAQTCRRRAAAGGRDGGRARLHQGRNRRLRGAVSGARSGDAWCSKVPARARRNTISPSAATTRCRSRPCSITSARGAISTPRASACGASALAATTRRAPPPSTSASRPASRSAGRSTGARPGTVCRS